MPRAAATAAPGALDSPPQRNSVPPECRPQHPGDVERRSRGGGPAPVSRRLLPHGLAPAIAEMLVARRAEIASLTDDDLASMSKGSVSALIAEMLRYENRETDP